MYIFVDIEKRWVLSLVGEIRCNRNDRSIITSPFIVQVGYCVVGSGWHCGRGRDEKLVL